MEPIENTTRRSKEITEQQNYGSKYWPDFPPYPCSSLGAFVNHGALRLMIPILFRCISLATKTNAKLCQWITSGLRHWARPKTIPSPPHPATNLGTRFSLFRNNVVAPPSLHSLSAKSVFVKGAIHWMGSNKRGDLQVLSFHVADEEFSYIELPMFGGGDNNGNPLRRRIYAFGDYSSH
ncbi:hypothetical protein Ancab_021608 [Ancistrocladus abbreviatus]